MAGLYPYLPVRTFSGHKRRDQSLVGVLSRKGKLIDATEGEHEQEYLLA